MAEPDTSLKVAVRELARGGASHKTTRTCARTTIQTREKILEIIKTNASLTVDAIAEIIRQQGLRANNGAEVTRMTIKTLMAQAGAAQQSVDLKHPVEDLILEVLTTTLSWDQKRSIIYKLTAP